METSDVGTLHSIIAALQKENVLLRKVAETETRDSSVLTDESLGMKVSPDDISPQNLAQRVAQKSIDVTDLFTAFTALAAAREETKVGQDYLFASETALASSRAETMVGRANLLESEIALAASQVETTIGVADLLAVVTALGASRAETKIGVASLLTAVSALAASRAETKIGQDDLLASKNALASSRAETMAGRRELLESELALAASQAETLIGIADLLTVVTALATSRAEAKIRVADLLSAVAALAASTAETKIGRDNLLVSQTALASSRAQIKTGQADLMAIKTALAASQAETTTGVADLLAAVTSMGTLAVELEVARDMAERANLAKSHFLAGMSHELRTPLHGILGYVQLLRLDGPLNDAQIARVASIADVGCHLLEMINTVLDLSELDVGRSVRHAVECDVGTIAAACLELIRPTAKSKKLSLAYSVTSGTQARLVADPTRLRQILLNLLGNAVKFTIEGGIQLHLRRALQTDDLRIEVTDTGPGISDDLHKRLFQEFERGAGTSVNNIEGAGLGLALSARLATFIGARIGWDPNPSGGSVFWLELPNDLSLTVAEAVTIPQGPPRLAHDRTLQLLVVDDMEMNREITAAFLRSAGHVAVCVESGKKAIDAVTTTDFDVVLMDIQMPGMNGLEATQAIRALGCGRNHVPIIAITAQAFEAQIEACREAGMDSHLSKPFNLEGLMAAVINAVGPVSAALSPSYSAR